MDKCWSKKTRILACHFNGSTSHFKCKNVGRRWDRRRKNIWVNHYLYKNNNNSFSKYNDWDICWFLPLIFTATNRHYFLTTLDFKNLPHTFYKYCVSHPIFEFLSFLTATEFCILGQLQAVSNYILHRSNFDCSCQLKSKRRFKDELRYSKFVQETQQIKRTMKIFFKFCGLFRKLKQKLSQIFLLRHLYGYLVSSCTFSNWSLYGKNKNKGSDTDLDEAMIEYFISYFSRFLFYSEDFHNFFLSLFFFFQSTTFTAGT